ncbi:MmcQ/YjbR family DNA-binding protein [Pseudahrensia aquimaris]|uniref:MmcQ/YjbR family DNA-binding protein n=1 Tax=Pseudahrensia aquimaris TaxID=744461 RepID=A0ABW3FHB0_9HYPH
MDRAAFDAFCASLPATFMVVQWGDAHVWKVGNADANKVFALSSNWGDEVAADGHKIVFKCSDMGFRILTEEDGVIPAPYMGRHKYVQVAKAGALSEDELRDYISAAHEIMAAKLTKAQREAAGLD